MRGIPFATRLDRCPRCVMMRSACICDALPTVVTRTRIVIIRHARELVKPSGTARIAVLALPNAEIIDYRDEQGDTPAWVQALHPRPEEVLGPDAVAARLRALPSPHLLFPTGRTSADAPPTLVVLDGTWRQARQMFRRIPGVPALPTVSLDASAVAVVRLRNAFRAEERSTLEAIADAIAALEGVEVAAPLHALHERFVRDSLRSRGRMRPATDEA
ncbi:MAG: tRNA-uridine aminocarboxypropyltransferase [Polyangia bacterium]